jgi:hypothetical protein
VAHARTRRSRDGYYDSREPAAPRSSATDMRKRNKTQRFTRTRTQRALGLALICLALCAGSAVRAAVFRCVDANGVNTYADRPCVPNESENQGQSRAAASSDSERQLNSAKTKKAARILDLLRIAPSEPEIFLLQRTVDDAAPDLVQALDPDNASWTPANAKWHSVLEFVKADLRRDVQTALRRSASEMSRVTVQQFAARADEADLDVVLAFLGSGDGARYRALESEVRHIVYDALDSLLAQEPIPEERPSEATLRRRKELLSLTLDYRIVKDGGGPPRSDLYAGSAAVADYSARHDGLALDALIDEYEPYLPQFHAFTDSPTAKTLLRALEPAMRTYRALSSVETTNFAEMELDKYFARWRAVYGPPIKAIARTTVMVRGRMVMISQTTQIAFNAAGSPEGMAIACEQREDNLYQTAHRSTDNNAQTAALKAIQNRCRSEQRLPPL